MSIVCIINIKERGKHICRLFLNTYMLTNSKKRIVNDNEKLMQAKRVAYTRC